MSQVKAGKRPIKEKSVGPSFEGVSFGRSELELPNGLKKQLKDYGFECRFISSLKLKSAGGFHKNGWKPFNRADFKDAEGKDLIKLDQFLWGNSPDGTINRNELVLAIRPTEISEAHRADIKKRTDIQSGSVQKQAAESLRRVAKENNLDVQITEGYDDNN